MCTREEGSCSQYQEPLSSSLWLLCSLQGPACHPIYLPLHFMVTGWARMVAFQPSAAQLHREAEGTCVVIQLPPPCGEMRTGKRQVRRQKTKRLSNCLQQNREFHKGMLNLVAPWQNAKIHSHCLTRHRGPEPGGPGLRIIWSVHTSDRHCFRFSLGSSKWQCNGLHHVFLKIFFKTKRVVCLFFPLNKIVNSFAMKNT